MQRRPLVALDRAKDTEAARALKKSLLKDFTYQRSITVASISSDKNISTVIDQLAEAVDRFIITSETVMRRGSDSSTITRQVERLPKRYDIVPYVKNAVRRALELATDEYLICVTA